MQEINYPIGTLVKHLYFPQGLGVVTGEDKFNSSAFWVHWLDVNEDRREMEWEIISLEEMNND